MPGRHLGLYIHIPYCTKKCFYCDFTSLPLPGGTVPDEYVKALHSEMALLAPGYDCYEIDSIYLGGGTPSLLSVSQLDSIMKSLAKFFHIKKEAEITMEVNPGTVWRKKLAGFREGGINRISLGVQSLIDEELKLLGRIHQARDAWDVVMDLHFLRLTNFNIDLIYGLPGQSIERWKKNLEAVIDMQPAHISAYLLQLEPTVPLAQDLALGLLGEPAEEAQEEMYELARGYLTAKGFGHYEISNFSRPGFECRHNIGYWRGRPYLGLGSAAVSCVGGNRWINPWPPENYWRFLLNGEFPQVETLENMNRKDLLAEAMIMGLRMTEGVDLGEVKEKTGLDPLEEYRDLISVLVDRGCLIWKNYRLCLNPDYYFVSNQILCRFTALRES